LKKVVIKTKFNRSGKRVLTIPIDYPGILAPRYFGWYKKKREAIDQRYKQACDNAKQKYIESMANSIAKYVTGNSTTGSEEFKATRVLASRVISPQHPQADVYPGSWAVQLGISSLTPDENKAWVDYIEETRKGHIEREISLREISSELSSMKSDLIREVTDHYLKRNST